MAVYFLPVGNNPDQTTSFTLEGVRYDFRVRYNQRLTNVDTALPSAYDGWQLYISLSGQNAFISTPLKTSRDLLISHRYKPDCPKGRLALMDTLAVYATQNKDYNYSPERVTYEGLGDRWQLVYVNND